MDPAGIKSVALPGFEVPTDRNGQLWVHFAPHDKARYVSAVDVLEGRVTADRLSRRLVLIGTSAAGLLDLKTTPNDPTMPGVEIHAQVLEGLLSDGMLSQPYYAIVAEMGAAGSSSALPSSGWRRSSLRLSCCCLALPSLRCSSAHRGIGSRNTGC